MVRIGYARVSSTDQNLDRQLEQMQDCEKVFQEAVSGASKERSQLQALLQYIREGDIVAVTELERLG
ncbi:recombinase family protein, partial [Streptococcus sanguinis]